MAFVQSSGALVALDRQAPYPQHANFSLRLSDFYARDYSHIYRKQKDVRSMVGFIARNIAQLGLHVYRRADEEDRQRVRDHRLVDLLTHPLSGAAWMTQYRMVHSLVVDLCVYDWALFHKSSDGEGRWSLLRVPPTRFSPLGNGYWPDRFEIRGAQGGRKELPAAEFVFFQGSLGLDDSLLSVPPIESLRETLAEEWESIRQRQDFWRNGARTSGVLQHPGRMSPEAAKGLSATFQTTFTRDGSRPGGVPVLEEGMKLNTSASMTSRDAQYIEARKLTREECAAAWHIPPAMAGITSQAPFASIREQHQMLYQDTLGPWLQMIQQDFNAQVVPDFADREGIYVEFNIEEKLRGAFEDQAESLQRSVGGPWMTRNEARKVRNLPAVDGGDELIIPLNVLIGGQANPLDADGTGEPSPSGPSPVAPSAQGATPRELAEIIQKIYLGVGVVVSAEEARTILVEAGANLDATTTPAPRAPAASRNGTPMGPVAAVMVRHLGRWANQMKRAGKLDEGRCVRELAADLPSSQASVASAVFAHIVDQPDPLAAIEETAAAFAAAT